METMLNVTVNGTIHQYPYGTTLPRHRRGISGELSPPDPAGEPGRQAP
ncbi:MAG: hypothetical protein ACLU38_13195 [Dysosmobacter sp.]